MTILDELAGAAKDRTDENKRRIPADEMKKRVSLLPKMNFEFEKALGKQGLSFICECKKASPSKGIIAEKYPYIQIAKEYQEAGADCISVLTEPTRFLGSTVHLKEITEAVTIPCLRKDFTVDEYMIYEARMYGASAVLLICSLLSCEQLLEYREICDSLGMTALVEAHDGNEIQKAIRAGARVIGVNNRNLKDFSVDCENSTRFADMIPEGILFVSESGVRTREDVERLRNKRTDAVLIGETMMRAADKKRCLSELKGAD